MKKTILALGLMAFFAGTDVQAQPNKKADKDRKAYQQDGKRHNKQYNSLNLTADQKAKIEKIEAEYKSNIEKINKKKLTADDRKKQMTAARETRSTKIKAVLTTEQLQQLEKGKAQFYGKGPKGHGKMKPGVPMQHDRVDRAKKDGRPGGATLTDEQKAKLKEIDAKYEKEYEKMRNLKLITEKDREEALKKVREAHMNERKAVLAGQK